MGLKGRATPHGFCPTLRDWASERELCLPTGQLVPAYSWVAAELALGTDVRSAIEAAYHRSDHLQERRRLMGDWNDLLRG